MLCLAMLPMTQLLQLAAHLDVVAVIVVLVIVGENDFGPWNKQVGGSLPICQVNSQACHPSMTSFTQALLVRMTLLYDHNLVND